MKKYLLPCACGKSIEVDSAQSGLMVGCGCGAQVEVPTMRGLEQLRVAGDAAADPARRQSSWGPRQGMLFLAAVLLFTSGPAAAYIQYKYRPPQELNRAHLDALQAHTDSLTPEHSWRLWSELSQSGIVLDQQIDEVFQAARGLYVQYLSLALVGVGIGVLLGIVAFVAVPGKSASPAAARSKPAAKTGTGAV